MLKVKKKAKKKLKSYEERVSRCTVTPQEKVYMDLYSVLQVLYAQKKYSLVTALCNAVMQKM